MPCGLIEGHHKKEWRQGGGHLCVAVGVRMHQHIVGAQ